MLTSTAHPSGSVELICGCMFSGKTQELLRRARAHDPHKVVVFKHRRDDRYSPTQVVTHTHDAYDAVTVTRAVDILERVPLGTEFVGIDEAHFFDSALPGVCRDLARRGVQVVVTGLDLDSWGREFAQVRRLRDESEVVLAKKAPCARCGRPADHTQRTTPIVDGNMVGGPEAFEPRCPDCWRPPPEAPID